MLTEQQRLERDARILELFHARHRRIDIAAEVGVTPTRISQIIKGHNREPLKRRDGYWHSRVEDMLQLYRCGFSLDEIAERLGSDKAKICTTLQGHPDYEPRRGGRTVKAGPMVSVPGWVDAEWRDRYRRIAQRHDEQTAAACIRTAKRLGVSA